MESLRKQAARILREKKKYKLWLTAFLCMAVLVTAGTVAALTMNGQALNRKEKLLICGLDVHEHTEQCRDSEGELVCGQADYVIHIHNDDCYGKDGALVCALPERKPHVHDAACLEEQKTLTCTLEETQGHQHDEACYTKVQGELTCGQDGAGHQHGPECYTKVQGEPICGTDGTGHQHGPACYAKVQGELTCASTEEGHEHNEGCYAWSEELTCGLAEEVHEHTDECYAWSEELTCGLAEEAHEHTDDCYAWSEELNCEIPEGEDAHAHTEDCYTIEENYICGELELHAHEEDCYDEEGNLICEEIELLEHVHADDCFEIIEPDASGEESEESDQESGASEESQEGNAAADESGAEGSEAEEDSEGEPEDSEGEEELFRKTYEDAEIRVVAEYHKSANIPEEAQLVAERIGTEAEGDAPEAAEEDGDEAAGGQDMESAGDGQELPDAPEAEDKDAGAVPGEDGMETATEEVSYRLRFLIDGEEIRPEGTVTFTVQGLDENGNDAGQPVILVCDADDSPKAMVITLVRKTEAEVQHEFRKEAWDGNISVIVEYDTAANIPEEAELQVRQITAENDAAYYAQREAEYLGQIAGSAAMDLLFDIGFYAGGVKIEPEAAVSITIQIPEGFAEEGEEIHVVRFGENGAEEMEDCVSADEAGKQSAGFRESIPSTYAVGKAEPRNFSVRKECRIDALNIIVIAEYDLGAEIPEEAELKVEAITPESNPEYYAQCEAEYLEQAGQGAQMDMLLNIGFYDADGAEIEPKKPVSITIQMLDDQYEDGEQMSVVHFGDDATEKLDASEIRTDEEGNKATSFEASSFSPYALGRSGEGGSLLENGRSYQIYCESGGNAVALSHKDNKLEAIAVEVDASGVVVPTGYAQADFVWEYEDNGYGGYALKYHAGAQTYYLWDVPEWAITGSPFSMLKFWRNSTDGIMIMSTLESDYLCYENNQIVAKKQPSFTEWKFKILEIEKTVKVNYYKNENSVTLFQDEAGQPSEKGTLLGSKQVAVEEIDGRDIIRIPLTGTVTGQGGEENDIGALEDYSFNGNTYKFYGWSLRSNSNYRPDIDYLIYCGTPVQINGCTVPTYVTDGMLTMDVTGRTGGIDLHAIWAAPSNVAGSDGVKYYGTNYEELNKFAEDKDRKGRGVMFFVRLDGQIPNEPANKGQEGILNRANYTEHVFAKDDMGQEKRMPLKYWKHIYGVQNGDAVEANLAYKPTDEDLLAAIKAKNGSIKVAGQPVDFSEMTVDEFTENYYVAWYVCKDGRDKDDEGRPLGDCWHIDGVLLKKTEQWNLVYADNGITDKNSIIPGTQYAFRNQGSLATVHNTLIARGGEFLQSDIPPKKTGYNFAGWNTSPDGSGTWFTAGTYKSEDGAADTDFSDNDTITVEVIAEGQDAGKGQVYKNGEKVDGLFATKKANGIYEVILYPQWAKGTNLLTVAKTDTEGNPLKGAKFKLYECALTDGRLQKGRELTAPGGSAVSEGGILAIHDLENETYYCLEESYAPNGYEQRNEIYFSVVVASTQENATIQQEVMSISILDANAQEIENPEWLETQYTGGGTSGTGGIANIRFTIKDEAILQQVSFRKTDETGAPLAGAQFTLWREEEGEYKEIGTSFESDAKGVFDFKEISKLSYGRYKLEETKVPTGYRKTTVYFEINDPVADGDYNNGMVVTKVEIDGAEVPDFDKSRYAVDASVVQTTQDVNGDNIPATRYSYKLTVQNERGMLPVALQKRGDDGQQALAGAEFTLYADIDKASIVKQNIVSGQDGKCEIGDLAFGTYYLYEEKAPDGYNRLSEPIRITVNGNGVSAQRGTTGEAITVTPDKGTGSTVYVLEIFNSKGIMLPETGGSGTEVYTLGGLAVIAASLMYGLGMRRRKEKGGRTWF